MGVANLFPTYDAKIMAQCVDVCRKWRSRDANELYDILHAEGCAAMKRIPADRSKVSYNASRGRERRSMQRRAPSK